MTERGFIALYRGYFDHDFFKKEALTEREAFQWLIMEACWEPKTIRIDGVKVTLQRGQLAHSLRFLAEAWGPDAWDISRVRRFLLRMEAEGMISRNTFETPNGTQLKHQTQCLSICNYDKFQSLRNTGQTENETPDFPKAKQSKPDNQLTIEPKEEKDTSTDLARAFELFNEAAARVGWPTAQRLNSNRRRGLTARLAECGGLDGWAYALAKAEASDFLAGRSQRANGHENWSPNLDFFLQPKSFTKLMEGGYDNKSSGGSQTEWQRILSRASQYGSGGDQHRGDIPENSPGVGRLAS